MSARVKSYSHEKKLRRVRDLENDGSETLCRWIKEGLSDKATFGKEEREQVVQIFGGWEGGPQD